MDDVAAASQTDIGQERRPDQPQGMADFLRKLGFASLELLVQENGRPEDGFIFRAKHEREGQAPFAPASCIVKLFTATLFARLVEQKKIDLQQTLPEVFSKHTDFAYDLPSAVSEIRVFHLLSHTHGLGSSLLNVAPCEKSGFIDLQQVMGYIRKEGSLYPPGKFHSYGNIGYHVLGILIEAIREKKYHEVLRDEIFSPLQAKYGCAADDLYYMEGRQICPASGTGLCISSRALFLFARALLADGGEPFELAKESVRSFMTPTVSAPGWSPFLKGAGIGWKDYGNGWLGHNGATEKSVAILRINTKENHIVALSGSSVTDNKRLSSVFMFLIKGKFPSLFEARPPAPQPVAPATNAEIEKMVGVFGNTFFRYAIAKMHDGLILEISRSDANSSLNTVHSCPLIKGGEDVFFLQKPWGATFFLQLICDENADRCLWDHESVWPELTRE